MLVFVVISIFFQFMAFNYLLLLSCSLLSVSDCLSCSVLGVIQNVFKLKGMRHASKSLFGMPYMNVTSPNVELSSSINGTFT